MYIGTSLFLIAIGAVLRWAVTVHPTGFDIQIAGLIILIVGIVGLIISLYLWLSRRPPRDYLPPENGALPPGAPHDPTIRS